MPDFNPNYLIHVANVLLLGAFAVRDVLLLRTLFLVGSFFAIGYYYLQTPPLWDALAWTVLYCLIHGYWIVRIWLERRPVNLTPDEQALYQLCFGLIDERKFARFVGFGTWHDAQPGETLSKAGEPVDRIIALVSGTISASVDGRRFGELGPGSLVGTTSEILNELKECDFVAEAPTRYVTWPIEEVRKFLEKDPEFRAQVRAIVSKDLAKKLHEVARLRQEVGA